MSELFLKVFQNAPESTNGSVLSTAPAWLNDAMAEVESEMAKDGGHDWGHLSRVVYQAKAIANSDEFSNTALDGEVLCAAVLFHDVVNLPKDSPNRKDASKLSADHAISFFGSIFDEEQQRKLRNAIEAHSFSAAIAIECDEAKIVQDADRLESVGALAIARTFYVSGLMESTLFHPEDPFGNAREKRDDRSYAVDHFYEKVFLLPALMNTSYAKELGVQRNKFLEAFLEQLKSEIEF